MGLVKSRYMLPLLVVDQTQASECSEHENFEENDRPTIKSSKYLSNLTFSSVTPTLPLINVININNH